MSHTMPVNPGPEVPGRRAQVRVDGQSYLIAIPPELDHLFSTAVDFYSISTTHEHDIIPPGLCPENPKEAPDS